MSESTFDKVKQFTIDCLLGGTAGSISKTVAAPLERVKLLLQTQDANKALTNKYTGFGNCMMRVYTEEGFLAYWRGNWANVVRYFPTTALNFGFKGFFNSVFPKYDADKYPVKFTMMKVLAGGSAGACCMMFVYPLDFARTRMAADVKGVGGKRQFNGLTHCLTSILKSDGVGGLYQGIGISLGSIFIYRGLYFGGYDTGKRMFTGYESWNLFYKWCFAQVITNFSEIISYPFDTIRRRLMMNSGSKVPIYSSTMDCVQ